MQKQVNVNLNFFTWRQTCFNTHLHFHTYAKTNKCTLKFLFLDGNIFNMYTLKFPHLCSPFQGKTVCCGDKTFFSYFLHALAGTCSRPITLCFSSTTHFLFKFLKEKKQTNKISSQIQCFMFLQDCSSTSCSSSFGRKIFKKIEIAEECFF